MVTPKQQQRNLIIFSASAIVLVLIWDHQNGFATATLQDPCATARKLTFLRQREVGYKLAKDELPICDQYFYDDWYEMYDFVTASTEENCGTNYNWYRQGELPKDDDIHMVTYCLNVGDGKCGFTKQAHVKKCSDQKYVFELFAVHGCSQAYCIERLNGTTKSEDVAPDISDVSPTVTARVARVNDKNELEFYCNFTVTPPQTEYFFIVEWGISTGLSVTDRLLETQPIKYGDFNTFVKSTALTEHILRQKGFGRLGITISCSTLAMTSATGAVSAARTSPSEFFGIEVLDKKINLNSTGESTVSLRLTAPFGCEKWETTTGCSIGLTLYIPQNTDHCRPTSLAQKSQVDRLRNRCGVLIKSSEIGTTKHIRVGSILGENGEMRLWKYTLMFGTQSVYNAHPLFQNYIPDSVEVDVATDMTKLAGKWCSSQNDPHMTTFDGLAYENQNGGTFVLYKNSLYNVQVQMKTTSCWQNYNIFCNCGVAVNAGRDVFILDKCPDGYSHWNPIFRCKDTVLARKVTKDSSGTKFVVYLPTGTEVHITISSDLISTITIKASAADWQNTEGLCGVFNGNTDDDLFKRPGSVATDSNLSWLVSDKENLFLETNDNHLKAWSQERMQCHCPVKYDGGPDPEAYIECHPDQAKKCKDPIYDSAFNDRCTVQRVKRNAHGIYVHRGLDRHFTTDTNFVHSNQYNGKTKKLAVRRDVYDHVSARADCLKILNTTAFQKCSDVPLMNIDQVVEECILDAVASNTMDWTMAHLNALKDRCVYEVRVNQPLTTEDLAGTSSSVSLNNSSVHTTVDEAGPPIIAPPSSAFTPEFLQDLKTVVCLNDCSGNGLCNNGSCECDGGFIGTDCSIDSSKPPVMEGIPDNGTCDIQFRECAKTSVFGKNFVSTPNLSCNLVPFKVELSLNIVTEIPRTSKANLETFVEVSCSLKQSRKKHATTSDIDDYIAEGYRVSVSNDGVTFSEEDILIIFDSLCVNCSKTNGKVTCIRKPEFCIMKGRCYRLEDEYGCFACAGNTENDLEWIRVSGRQDCPEPLTPTPETKRLWIIPVVICPVIVVLLTILAIYLCKRKKRAKPSSYVMSPVNEANVEESSKMISGITEN